MSVEISSIFWGCAMLSGALLLHAKSDTSQRLSEASLLLGCLILVMSFGYGLEPYICNYPSGLQDIDAYIQAQERGDIIFRGFAMLSGVSTILASLDMKKNKRGQMFGLGLLLLVGALLNGMALLNTGWFLLIGTALAISVGTTTGIVIDLITQRLQRRS